MIRLLSVLCMVLLLSLVSAGAENSAAYAKSPIRFGGAGDDYVVRSSTLALSNGNLLLSIATQKGKTSAARRNIWTRLICLKPYGSILWETEFGEEKGVTLFTNLTEQPDQTVTGYISYSIDQHGLYKQKRAFSLIDGTLIKQGEREAETDDTDTHMYIEAAGTRFLRIEIHNAQTTTDPRYYQLEEADGKILWRVEGDVIGLSNCEGAVQVSAGTMLYGMLWVDAENGSKATAVLLNDQGKVLWSVALDDLKDTTLDYALAAGNNRVLLSGHADGPANRLYLLIDAKTGSVLWRMLYSNGEGSGFPKRTMLETDEGYLIADTDKRDYSGLNYVLLVPNGEVKKQWLNTLKDTTIIGTDLFRWNGEIWIVYTAEKEGDMDVILERVEIPNN